MGSFEYFDHTADMGVRVRGKDLAELFTDAALGMFNLIAPLEQFEAQDAVDVLLKAENVEELLWSWLRELHYLFSTQKLIFKEFEYKELSEKMVWATCWGEYFDPEKHQSEREVKAVTHHGFQVKKEEDGWKAEVIFDI
jgi:SHS2 domain-containing protein